MTESITSPQNSRIKNAVKLRDRRSRTKQGRTIVDGAREIERAFAAGVEIVELFVCADRCSPHATQVVEQAKAVDTQTLEVAPLVFDKLAFGDRDEGVVAVATTPNPSLDELSELNPSLVVVLERVEKPGNIGAIIRSADGAGASALVVADAGTDLFNPNTIRASLGLIFSFPVYAATSQASLQWLRQHNFQILTAVVDAQQNCYKMDYTNPTAFVLGNEASGLSRSWQVQGTTGISVPMLGQGDSLNVSVSAAILLYEAQRQRTSN